jgi:lipoprotein NlpD
VRKKVGAVFPGLRRACFYWGISFLLLGCFGGTQPPVSDRPQPPSIKVKTHRVNSGETLFSIAWTYGLDYRRLAELNGIGRPYRIYAGQELVLDGSTAMKKKTAVKVSPPVVKKKEQHGTVRIGAWQWPVPGKVLKGYRAGKPVHKGIDLAGNRGDSVAAANNGKVVYAGDGIRGYGQLVIVKHDDTYLSAYAHNSRITVTEGERVKAGQKIAEIGASGANSVKLHFEVRQNGGPINPLNVLPRR